MKQLLKLEEAAMFGLGAYLALQAGFDWWWFLVLLIAPDIGMLGYLGGNRLGAFTYNLLHHKAVAVAVWGLGVYLANPYLIFAGGLLFAHSSMDRIFGYGLKYVTGFKDTHLGPIGS